MGRYQPISRAYTCFHEHCSDMRSKEFLCWVEEQGGPKHEHGIRDDLMAKAMDLALSKIQPNEKFPDVAAQIVADVQRKELGRVEKSSWFDRFAYIPFGAGPRICPGRYLALLEMKLAMAVLLGRFDIEAVDTPDGKEAPERLSFTMTPVGLTMRVRARG